MEGKSYYNLQRKNLEALANEDRNVGTKMCWSKQGLIFKAKFQTGVRGGAVGWGTEPQAGR